MHFYSSRLMHLLKFSFQEKRVLNFALRDRWNVKNSIEKAKVYFPFSFMNKIKLFKIKESKNVSPLISLSSQKTNKQTWLSKVE